nr:DUF6318 family protein [Paenarthrobacter sp. Y-19]
MPGRVTHCGQLGNTHDDGVATSSVSSPVASAAPPSSGAYKPADASGKAQNVPVPVMPELAKENSKAGLEAFIRYWYAQMSYAYETGETKQLLSLSSPACTLCASLEKGIEAGWQEGRWIKGGTLRSATVETDFNSTASTQVAAVQVIQESIEIRTPDGSLYQEPTAATNSASRASLRFEENHWSMIDLGLIR